MFLPPNRNPESEDCVLFIFVYVFSFMYTNMHIHSHPHTSYLQTPHHTHTASTSTITSTNRKYHYGYLTIRYHVTSSDFTIFFHSCLALPSPTPIIIKILLQKSGHLSVILIDAIFRALMGVLLERTT